jgi:uncharacterized protein (UPF0335 family)
MRTMTEPGDNSFGTEAKRTLRTFIERIERLEEEKSNIGTDIREVYAEAKATGFDVKAMRAVVRMRRQDAEKRKEHEALVDLYMHALGSLADTPLGRAAIVRDLGEAAADVVAKASEKRADPDPDPDQPNMADPPFAVAPEQQAAE